MIALDTNILLHARRQELNHHPQARILLSGLAERMVEGGRAAGTLAHDAYIAAPIEHGVSELLTLDRDFARFHGLKTRNPFKPIK